MNQSNTLPNIPDLVHENFLNRTIRKNSGWDHLFYSHSIPDLFVTVCLPANCHCDISHSVHWRTSQNLLSFRFTNTETIKLPLSLFGFRGLLFFGFFYIKKLFIFLFSFFYFHVWGFTEFLAHSGVYDFWIVSRNFNYLGFDFGR